MSERKAGDRYVKQVNRQGVVTWSVFEWKILGQVGPLEACLVAGGLPRADAELLAHGRERIARLEGVVADLIHQVEFSHAEFHAEANMDGIQLREARAALADARDDQSTTT